MSREQQGVRPDAQKPFGPFVLERRIAVGGSAEVFLARPKVGTVPAPRLVVKRLLPSARESGFDVLEREAALHRAVAHPNVVTVFGAGMVGDEPYLAMEYVEGVDLYRLLRRADAEQRRIPTGVAIYIARRVLAALSAVHSACDAQGGALLIVHRDVTPSNVYLSIEGDVKLGDFGIARAEQPAKPAPPAAGLKGKFGYLAPEQVAGEPFDSRADLFSLTALLGEMLIGDRVFPGSGQLAVLLAIRDANIEPLRGAAITFPPGLFAVCEKALARHPDDRYASAGELSRALEPFEKPTERELRRKLAEWVTWARDSSQLARKLEGQIRDSVSRMQAAKSSNSQLRAVPDLTPGVETLSRVRQEGGAMLEDVSFSKLIEMVATGDLSGDDEVALMGADFRPIRDVHELSRHLLPSTTATTNRVFEPGAPDYSALLRDTSMLQVLAHLRTKRESGALFVQRSLGTGRLSRKEMYLENGRLHHVASSEREELLGEYLVRRGKLSREDLETALGALARFGGRLGDTLIGLALVDAVDVFRAIRDQGRDRVASLCSWDEGLVSFYRGTSAMRVEFPLDLDLASPMMAGAILAAQGEPRSLLPLGSTLILPGQRAGATTHPKERGTAPASLQLVAGLVEERFTIDEALDKLTSYHPRNDARIITSKEACAALVTAQALGWIHWSS
ncbi:MAG TPA: serine/threonine-protein kinase [Polyangiaceae bacterium]|nr:serine/threonine-protein kinase [Polyangiaceae bacterium]